MFDNGAELRFNYKNLEPKLSCIYILFHSVKGCSIRVTCVFEKKKIGVIRKIAPKIIGEIKLRDQGGKPIHNEELKEITQNLGQFYDQNIPWK